MVLPIKQIYRLCSRIHAKFVDIAMVFIDTKFIDFAMAFIFTRFIDTPTV